jgi:thymidylate synthase
VSFFVTFVKTIIMSNKLDLDYQNLLKDILKNGIKKSDRTGTGTISVFGRQIRHRMSDGFPLLTSKKMAFKSIIIELIWFLRGDTNIRFLIDNECHIWNGDAYKHYLKTWTYEKDENDGSVVSVDPIIVKEHTKEQFIYRIKTDNDFAKKWGDLGSIYGKQWRKWQFTEFEKINNNTQVKIGHVDQIANLINELKFNPDSRRLMVNAWNPGELDQCVLPPCHYGFQLYTRELTRKEKIDWLFIHAYETGMERSIVENQWGDDALHDEHYNVPKRAISLMWNQRSVDTGLGLPFNIASYALLLIILGKLSNMIPDELIGNLGDCHIYSNHVDELKTQSEKEFFELPTLQVSDKIKIIFEKFRGDYESIYGQDFGYLNNIDNVINSLEQSDFVLKNYKSNSSIKLPLSN